MDAVQIIRLWASGEPGNGRPGGGWQGADRNHLHSMHLAVLLSVPQQGNHDRQLPTGRPPARHVVIPPAGRPGRPLARTCARLSRRPRGVLLDADPAGSTASRLVSTARPAASWHQQGRHCGRPLSKCTSLPMSPGLVKFLVTASRRDVLSRRRRGFQVTFARTRNSEPSAAPGPTVGPGQRPVDRFLMRHFLVAECIWSRCSLISAGRLVGRRSC